MKRRIRLGHNFPSETEVRFRFRVKVKVGVIVYL